jgi:Na+/H+ antiporter NhaD/arsenite permease-like protein
MKTLFPANLEYSGHTFLLSAVSSQLISNVPTTLLLAKFTTQWQALLWGVNVGGFGSLMGSLANLIAYRFYTTHSSTSSPVRFTIKFMLFGYVAFFIGVGLYFIVFPYD